VITKVTEFEPYERLAWTGSGRGSRGHHAWILLPEQEGTGRMIVVSGVMTFSPSIHDRVVERARTLTAKTLKEPGCRTYGLWTGPELARHRK
jgi:hypothetical protein